MRIFFTILITICALKLSAQKKTLTAAAMQTDLHILHDSWISLHPGLYRYNTPEQIETYFNNLQNKCAAPLPENEFYLLLSQLAAKVKCGHTYLNPLNLDNETAKRILPGKVIPIFFVITGDHKMIITHTVAKDSPYKKGDEIVAINSVPVLKIQDSLSTVSRSDGNHALGKKYNNMNETPDEANNYSLFDIYFPLFFGQTENRTITIRSFKNKVIHQYELQTLTLTERLAAYQKKYGPVPTGEKSWAYRLISPRTAYMKFGTFAFWNSKFDEKKFVDSAFADVAKHPGVDNLIIDIRGNEGGDNTGDYILGHLTNKKLGCDDPDHLCYRFLNVPDSLLPYLSTWDRSFKAPKNPNDFFVNEVKLFEQKPKGNDCAFIEPKPAHFGGKVYLLCDAKNSSAGYQMAQNVKINKLGTLVGETTGGSQQGINGGKFFFLNLPNSKFEVDLPLIFNYHPDKPDSGIVPDHFVNTRRNDIARQKDAQLGYALKLIDHAK